jgi:hypothetical protein
MLQAILSSQLQVIFMPPAHFSILTVQRGTIMKFVPFGIEPGVVMPAVPMPGLVMPGIMPLRSIIIAPAIGGSPFFLADRPAGSRGS